MYNDKYTKNIKLQWEKYTDFEDNKLPKDNEYCAYWSVISLDFIFANLNKEYYPQIF